MSQFSSLSRRGNYAYAGKVAANDALNAFIAQKKRSPDFGKFISEAEQIKAAERINATKRTQETFDTISKIEATSKINKIKFDADQNLKKSQRFAGVLGAAGQLVGGGINRLYDANQPRPERDTSIVDYLSKMNTDLQKQIKDQQSVIDSLPKPAEITPENPTTGSFNKTTPASSNPSTTQSFKFTPEQTKGLEAIRRVESGPFGYNAYNLGGKTEFDPIGSGSAADGKQFGKPLTAMTINEIDALGQAGKIHATGAYQFTHNTGSFREAAKFAGLSGDDLFTPENQDLMALTFGQKYGWQRWSGLKLDPEARDAAIAGFRQ
jgi:hypothetical protein